MLRATSSLLPVTTHKPWHLVFFGHRNSQQLLELVVAVVARAERDLVHDRDLGDRAGVDQTQIPLAQLIALDPGHLQLRAQQKPLEARTVFRDAIAGFLYFLLLLQLTVDIMPM
jgi:hypothetical protein